MNSESYLIDTHCHLNLPDFSEDLGAVLERAGNAQVKRIIVPGIDLETSKSALKMAESNSAIFFACGFHPNDAAGWEDGWLSEIEVVSEHKKCVAIGEIGLDFYREYCPQEIQMTVFKKQLALAEKLGLPVIVHCRQAFETLWPVLSEWHDRNPRNIGVLHAFDETVDEAFEAISRGFFIGIGGAYTYKNTPRRVEILREIPLESILLETDAPYLTPVPFRGRRNEPSYVRYTAEKVADVKELPLEKIINDIEENTFRLFERLS
ncbi:MAG: TatD family hydrolase [Flexilinea sp.]